MTVREFAQRIAARLCRRCSQGEPVHRQGLAAFTWRHANGEHCEAAMIHEILDEMERHGESLDEPARMRLLLDSARSILKAEDCRQVEGAQDLAEQIEAEFEPPVLLQFPCACTQCHCEFEVARLGALCEGCLTRCQHHAR